MKRILMIAPLPPPIHGSAMMTQYIKDSPIINEKLNLDWVNLSTSRRMDEIGKRSPLKAFRFIQSFFKTFWKLTTNRYDAYYIAITCHGVGFLKDAPFALLCKLFGKKLIIHQHNKGMSADVDRPIYRWLLPLVYRNSKVILLSWRLYQDIEKVVKKENAVICPNGIPLVKRLNKPPHPVPRLLFLSNLIESKGVLTLLDACKILKGKGYIFKCNFVGGETSEIDRDRFEKEVRARGLDKTTVYIGKKYGDDKQFEISKSDIFVFPTFYENECFPLVILEAMQQGVAVISTDEGGIPDIIQSGNNGLIVPSKSVEELAEAIAKLLDDADYRLRIAENGYNTYNNKYTLKTFETMISDILSKYN